jgi:hypothetical protein
MGLFASPQVGHLSSLKSGQGIGHHGGDGNYQLGNRPPGGLHLRASSLLNIGLLTPKQVLDAVLTFAGEHPVPLHSLEGFVRQILGWRLYVRAVYKWFMEMFSDANNWVMVANVFGMSQFAEGGLLDRQCGNLLDQLFSSIKYGLKAICPVNWYALQN